MNKEELWKFVSEKLGSTKLSSLSQKTINEELDDVLEDLGDDEAANDKIITKLANRLKRMDGNVHKSVSDEMKKNKEAEEERKRQEEEERQRREREKGKNKPSEDSKYDELLAEIKALKDANAERDKKAARSEAIESIKRGLRDKFDKAGLEMNDFFLNTALSKLEIPDKDIDVSDLVSKAESIYTADYKSANGGSAVPKKHSSPEFNGNGDIDDDMFEEIAKRRMKRFGDAPKK